ncbi:MAG: hypothetical protein Q7K25_06385 [Actinomycetota bacterium]|nr:hypothetical protein [Actinomycetota bacterium]
MSELADVAFALFALQQPVSLDEMAQPAQERRLIMSSGNAPGWFAAAASSSNLPEIAPELHVEQSASEASDREVMDLVWLYAPELRQAEQRSAEPPAAPKPDSSIVREPATSTVQIGLLRQLSDFDS